MIDVDSGRGFATSTVTSGEIAVRFGFIAGRSVGAECLVNVPRPEAALLQDQRQLVLANIGPLVLDAGHGCEPALSKHKQERSAVGDRGQLR